MVIFFCIYKKIHTFEKHLKKPNNMKTKTIASICFIFCSIQLWSTNKLPMTSDNCKTFLTSENEHGWSIGTTTSWNNNDGRTYSFVVEWDGVPGKISIEATRDGGTCNTTNYSDFYIYYYCCPVKK